MNVGDIREMISGFIYCHQATITRWKDLQGGKRLHNEKLTTRVIFEMPNPRPDAKIERLVSFPKVNLKVETISGMRLK